HHRLPLPGRHGQLPRPPPRHSRTHHGRTKRGHGRTKLMAASPRRRVRSLLALRPPLCPRPGPPDVRLTGRLGATGPNDPGLAGRAKAENPRPLASKSFVLIAALAMRTA